MHDSNHVCVDVLPRAGRRGKVAFSSSNSIGQVMRAANFSSSGVVVLFVKGQDVEAACAEVRKLSPQWAWMQVAEWSNNWLSGAQEKAGCHGLLCSQFGC
jgi:hypothetical protein